jgi:hypothetical protein
MGLSDLLFDAAQDLRRGIDHYGKAPFDYTQEQLAIAEAELLRLHAAGLMICYGISREEAQRRIKDGMQ